MAGNLWQSSAAPGDLWTSAGGFALISGPFRFVALDVETANSDPASICQIGLAFVRPDGGMHVTSTYVDPCQPFSSFNIQLHGIGPDKVRGAARFPTVLQDLADVLAGQPLIQHSTFDRGAIAGACRAYGLEAPAWRWENSVSIARRAWPEFRGNGGHGLGHLKRALGLEFDHHDAGEDAKAAAMVVLRAEHRTGLEFETLCAKTATPRKPSRPVQLID